ncbi:unnamed protein product, partial [Adineta ricciae]
IIGVYEQLDELIKQIRKDRERRRIDDIEEPLSINFFNHDSTNEKSIMELNGEFLQTQLLIDCLGRMQVTDDDKDKLIVLCKKLYKGNCCEQEKISEFQKTYTADQAIEWYSRNSFVYRVLNKALRVQNIDLLLLFRFFICDIEKQLKDNQYSSPVTVYRGQVLSKTEMNLFEKSTNQFLSVTSFFSTTLDPAVALSYIDVNKSEDDELQGVLLEIHATPSENQSKPFADISSMSYFNDEKEVLFMLGSIFRINGVNSSETPKRIHMTLCNDENQHFDLLFDFMKKKNCTAKAREVNFGRVLIGMAKFNAAENHFKCLVKTFSSVHPDIFHCYQGLGKILCEKCDFEESLRYFQMALEILYKKPKSKQIQIAYVHNNIGEVYHKKGDADQALVSYEQALTIFRTHLGERNENVAWCFNNIGIVYFMMKDYPKALENLEKAFELKSELLPPKHPCFGNTYVNLANVYYDCRDYDRALGNYEEAYEIFQTSLTPQHPSIARVQKNIGGVYEMNDDLSKANEFYHKALNVREKVLHSTHPDLLEIKQDIRRISLKILAVS